MSTASHASVVWRTTVVVHRYLGVAVGLLMLMWFGSGIVMMYVKFPEISERERMAALAPIQWQSCCRIEERISDDDQVIRAQIETVLGTPALRLRRPGQPDLLVDLAQGSAMHFDAERARTIALDAATRIIGTAAELRSAEPIEQDQWTVGRHLRDRPLYRFSFDDPKQTALYVSGTNGQIVLWTTATQRFWNWLGAVPHWLYLTALRSDGPLWTEVVIWTSILGTFLTVMGLALGIIQIRRSSISSYRGLFYWHHLAGLFFGVATLTWVVSGLFSMNPWGFLDSRGRGEQPTLQGRALRWSEVRQSIDAIRTQPVDAVSLTSAPYGDRLNWLAALPDGRVIRLDASGREAPLSETDLAEAAKRLAGSAGVASQAMLHDEDAYYFGPHEPAALPVYRIVLDDGTRYYLDPTSGGLVRRADANGRWHRWLFGGLHRIDFAGWLRSRPLWDILVLVLMLGGMGVAATGCWLALRRIKSDIRGLFHRTTGP